MTHQLIIIGAGPGGYEVAVKAAKEGLSVLVVEERHVGGTCLNEAPHPHQMPLPQRRPVAGNP